MRTTGRRNASAVRTVGDTAVASAREPAHERSGAAVRAHLLAEVNCRLRGEFFAPCATVTARAR